MANNALKLITQKVKDSMKAAYEKELQNYISGASDTAQKRYAAFEQSAKENPNAALQYLASNQMMKPKSLGDYHADDVRLAGTDRAAYARQLRDMGFFDTEENAYGGYAHNVSTNYLQKLLDTATTELGKSVQADKDHDAAMAAWKGENEKAYRQRQLNETSFNNWVAMSKYEGKDFSDPDYDPTDEDMLFLSNLINGTDYKNIVDMQQRMGLDEDSYSDEWDKMVDLWYAQDWANPALPTYTGMTEPEAYESNTGYLSDRVNTLQSELDRRTTMEALEAEAAAMPNFAELSVYQDPEGLADGSALENLLGVPEELRTSMYGNRDYFINNPLAPESKGGLDKYNKDLADYFDAGYHTLAGHEKATYTAFVNAQMLDKAEQYLEALSPMLLQRRADEDNVLWETLASDPATFGLVDFIGNIGQLGTGYLGYAQAINDFLGEGEGKNATVNDLNRRLDAIYQARDQYLAENDPLKDIKIFGMAPSQLMHKASWSIGGELGRNLLGGPVGSRLLAIGQSASGKSYENSDRSDMSNIARGLQTVLAGGLSGLTEAAGIDAFFDTGLPGAKEYIKKVLLSELGEEALELFGDEAIERGVSAVFGHKGEYRTAEEMALELAETMLMTTITVGGLSAPGAVQIRSANKAAGKGISSNDSIAQVLEIADSMDKSSASYAEAQNVKAAMEGGKKVSLNKLGRLANAMQKELGEEYGKVIGRVADDTIVERMVELGDSKDVAQKNVQAVKKAAQGQNLTAQERADLTESSTAIQVVEELAGEAETSGEMAAKMQMRSMETAAGIRRKQLGLQEAVRGKQVETDVFAAEDENAPVQTVKAKPGTGAVTFLGEASSNQQVTGSGTEAALTSRMRSMTASQRNTVNGIKAIAKATGVNMVLFESTKEGRAAGVQNGSFVRGTNTIYLDINAGISTESGMKGAKESGVLGYAMVRTLSHELTHFIEANSKEGYAALMEQAKREFSAKGKDWDKLVVAKAKMSAAQGEKLTRTGAEAEVLADACEMMLQDTAAIERLAKQNPSLKEKIAGFIRSFVQKIQKALRAIGAGSAEAKALMEMRDGLMQYSEELTRLWGAGLEEAVGNAQSVEQQAVELSDVNTQFSIRQEALPKKTGIAYKVFFEKNGKLYPPMVANPGGADTPVGVWLNADVGTAAPPSKTGRLQVKAGGKGTQGGSGSLAFRPGWHLGDIPKATQFNRLNKATGVKELFPYNFVWAECEYAMDVDYQEEAMSYGYNANGKFQHSLAGLPRLPVDGYYHYRTNPDPNTVPWVITGAMKVNKILSRAEVDAILREKGVEPTKWQGPDGEQMEAEGEVRQFSSRAADVSYNALISKPDMQLVQLTSNIASRDRKAIADAGYKNAMSVGKPGKSGMPAVHVKDIGRDVHISKSSLEHGLDRRTDQLSAATQHAGELLQNAILINAANAKLPAAESSYILLSAGENSDGTVTPVSFVVNRFTDQVESFDVLKSMKNKKNQPRITAGIGANALLPTDSTISIAELISLVKDDFTDVWSSDVMKVLSLTRSPTEITKDLQYSIRNAENLPDGQTEDASPDGTDVDTSTDSAYQQYSIRTWAESDYVTKREEAIDRLVNTLHVDREKAEKWIDDVNSISAIVLDNKARLDYIPTAVEGVSAFKSNPEYGGSIDMSTICAKRRLATGTLDAIQNALGDAVLTKDDFLHIREMMKERGHEVACGLCFVESSRKNLSKYTKQFLDQFNATHPDNQVSMTDFNTVDGLERVRLMNQEAYSEYEKFMNKLAQRKPKLFEKRTEYRHEILQKFKKDTTVGAKNINGGLRLQSFSDFEIVHLIDMMQVITDMASVGLAGQAYTKVPDFAWALGDTGLKINLSLIAKDVDENGNLIFDDVEGMNHEEAKRLRDAYSENVGTIVVAFTDEQIMAAMKSDFVDFIIPFHRSQWQKSDYKKLGLPEGTKDYTMHQNEKLGRKRVKENYMPNDYWDFSKTGKQNAQKYLDKCAADGRTPKFAKFLQNNGDGTYSMKDDGSTDGYWKLLIDFKMYDNDGVGSPQNPVQPNFNMGEAGRMLDTYNGIHDSFPVAQDVVDDFVKEYRGDNGGIKVSNGRVTIDNIQKSQRLPDDISTREYLADADSSIAANAEQANALEIYKTRIAAYREATQAVDQAKATLAATTDRDESIKARNRLELLQKQQSRAYNQLIAAEDTKHIRELTGATTEFIQKQLAGKTEADIASMIAEAESEIASLTEQLDGLKGASREQTESVKEQIRMLKARVTRLRNSATRKLLETRQHYQEMFQRDRTRREINAEAAKKTNHIKAVVKRLDDRIRHETDYHNVKEGMKPAVRKLVETFLDGFGNLVFDQKKADRLLTVYRELDKLDSDESSFYSDDVEAMLADLAALAGEDAERRAGGLSLMDNAETKLAIYSQVADIADNIWHMVQMADEVFVNGKATKFSTLGDSTGNAMLERKDYKQLYGWPGKVQRAIDDTIRRGNMIPTYFFDSLDNEGLQSLFGGVMNGQTRYAKTILDGHMKMQEAKRKYNYADWGNKKPVSFKTAQGHDITLTPEQMMWVYATAKRERSNELAATDHLGTGGFRYEGEVKGEKGLAVADKPHKLGEGDVQRISDMLTADQKAYADELVEYLSNDMAEVGNAASMEMFGIRKYQEKYYFPFKTASEQRYQRSDAGSTSTTNDSRVKHSSFTHRLTRHANNTLVMGDFSSIIADHINQMATYASFMNPIESMNRVLNYKVEEGDGTLTTIRALLGRKYGDAALRYVQDFMKDINGGAVTDNRGMGMINSLVSAFKRGAVAASLSVAVQQPTAYVRAFAYMNPKYFAHLTGERTKDAWDEVMQYSGTAVIKDMGKFDVGLGQTANEWIAEEDNGEFSAWERAKKYWPWGEGASWSEAKKRWDNLLTALPGHMDKVTWTHIWKAVKAEQRDLHPNMDPRSEAFLRACGKRFDYIINHTQVYDSVLSKSNLMRSKNALNRMATSFMSEPTLTANVLYSAIKGKHSKAQRGKMIAATVASNILASAAAAAVSAWNDDDDNRKAMEKYADKFTALAMDNLNPLGMLPYLSDVSSMLEGYSVERADASVVEDLIKHSSSFFGSLQKGEGVTWKQVENFAGTLLNLVGVPAKNISRDVRRLKNAVTTDWSAATPASVGFATLENIPYGMYADTKKAYYKRYVGSVIDGNRQKAYNIKDYMTSSKGTSENAWATGIRDVIKAMVASGSMTPEEATAFLREHAPYKNDKDNINKPKEWAGKQ